MCQKSDTAASYAPTLSIVRKSSAALQTCNMPYCGPSPSCSPHVRSRSAVRIDCCSAFHEHRMVMMCQSAWASACHGMHHLFHLLNRSHTPSNSISTTRTCSMWQGWRSRSRKSITHHPVLAHSATPSVLHGAGLCAASVCSVLLARPILVYLRVKLL